MVGLYAAIPVMDVLLQRFLPKRLLQIHASAASRLYWLPVYLYLPFQFGLVFYSIEIGCSHLAQAVLSGVLCGISAGMFGIAFAQALLYRRHPVDRVLGQALLHLIHFPHFSLEHRSRGLNPAQLGESVYRYSSRAIFLGLLKSARKNPKRMIGILGLQALLLAGAFAALGPLAIVLLICQGGVAIFLLKWVDYIEHYGLARRDRMAWVGTGSLTNWYWLNGCISSYRDRFRLKAYEALSSSSKPSDELPLGYSALAFAALVPMLWRRLMDPLVVGDQLIAEEHFIN